MPRTLSLRRLAAVFVATLVMASAPLAAQSIETVDPNQAIDGDLAENPGEPWVYDDTQGAQPQQQPQPQAQPQPQTDQSSVANWTDLTPESEPNVATTNGENYAYAAEKAVASGDDGTWHDDDLIGAAQNFFGENAEGIARMIEKVLADQGTPNGYIVGREAGGAFFIGARYGSGTLYHKVEGKMPVYWTGPSIGFDVGANGGKTFVLVYNLFDTEQLYERFPAGEGQAYLIGGVTASYLRKGDTVLIPISMGAGLRLGINAGYMKFSKKQRWLPF